MNLAIRHRLSAFADATSQIGDRLAFIGGELRCVPLRLVVSRAARRRGSNQAAEWQRIGGRLGYLRQHRLARGGHVWIRHGTADVFTVAEVLARDEYAIPDEARALLPVHPRVLDLGANIGVFGIRALRDVQPSVITSVEADPYNAQVLRRNAANVPMGSDWRVPTTDEAQVRKRVHDATDLGALVVQKGASPVPAWVATAAGQAGFHLTYDGPAFAVFSH